MNAKEDRHGHDGHRPLIAVVIVVGGAGYFVMRPEKNRDGERPPQLAASFIL